MKKILERVEKSLMEKITELMERKKNYENKKEYVILREEEKKPVLKRFKQLSYEYHSVAAKLPFDDEIEAKGKVVFPNNLTYLIKRT